MTKNIKYIYIVPFVIIAIMVIIMVVRNNSENYDIPLMSINSDIPDFSSYSDVKDKKAAFFEYFYPMIVNKNIKIITQRDFISNSTQLNDEIKSLCIKYKTECDLKNYKTKLLNHINVIPPSLAMAQAANESAWGTSRFARKGYNYYGIWCFSKGCGLIPTGRGDAQKHEVRKFDSPSDAVEYYIDNLNRHSGYKDLRKIRLTSTDSLELTKGLLKYSERGKDYISEIQSMIRFNKLKSYDKKMNKYFNSH
jgi:Bax protein